MFNIGYSLLPIRKLEGLHCHSLLSSGITQNITAIEWCNHCSCSTRFISPSVSNWRLCSNRLLFLFRLRGSGMLRTVTGYTGEKRTDIFKCNRQVGIHVGLHRVVLRVCRVFRYCLRPSDGTSALPPPSLELARFRPPEEERAFRALELCAVTV